MDVVSTPPHSPCRHFPFPLNVYAHALMLQEGKVTYLHRGLFQNNQNDFQTAQQHSVDLIISRLPPPGAHILKAGADPGTTFTLLTQLGYHVQNTTTDAHHSLHLCKSPSEETSVAYHDPESFIVAPESLDVVLFHESTQHIAPLVLFDKSFEALRLSGDLLIIDEFALKYDEIGIEKLHLLTNMITLAERCGFELIEHVDLSIMAAPTLDYLLHITNRHRQRLIEDLALSYEDLAGLDESNRIYQEKYASGHYGYSLLHFRKKIKPKWRLQLLQKHQLPDMLDLFKKTFHHDMTLDTWNWKYGVKSGHEIVIRRENQLIAHYGGVSRSILLFGTPQVAVQIGDVMVDKTERGITRKGPFFLMAATFLENYIGYGKPYLLGFGFPNERAMKVAERCGLYAEVGRMVEFSWRAKSWLPHWGTCLHPVNRNETSATITAINECWQRMATDLKDAIVGIRDWHYLQHRYFNHPNRQYQVILIRNRLDKRVRGVLVLHYSSSDCELIDMIAPLIEIPLLITHARRFARLQGINRIFCRITENFAATFAATGGVQHSLDIRIPANAWSSGPPLDTLKNHWWLMSGDMDFS